MSRIPKHVRELVVQWPDDAPQGAVEYFCRKHGVSRAWFYKVRARVKEQGAEAAMHKRSTRPLTSPKKSVDIVAAQIAVVRAQLTVEGKDAGARSIHDRLVRDEFESVPSVSTISRVLDRNNLVDRNHKKRPKRSYKRFQSTYVNERWQADAFQVVLATGHIAVVVEIIDDCSRFILAEHAGPSENNATVLEAFKKAIETYGRPVIVHTDNGAAFNRDRYKRVTRLKEFLNSLGVKTITGRPGHPQTQGKVERAHQTALKYIRAHQPHTLEDLQAVLDQYRQYYNTDRSHQALPPHTTPAHAYETWDRIAPSSEPITPPQSTRTRTGQEVSHAITQRILDKQGGVQYRYFRVVCGKAWAGQIINIMIHDAQIDYFDSQGTHMASFPWPPKQTQKSLIRTLEGHPPPPQGKTPTT